jgi:hypothetical protein
MAPFRNGFRERAGNEGVTLFHLLSSKMFRSISPEWKPDATRCRQETTLTRRICLYILLCTNIMEELPVSSASSTDGRLGLGFLAA